MAIITEHHLRLIRDEIVRAINPKSLILFGSQARGTAHDRSDIDLLVVNEPPSSSGWSRRKEIGKIRRCIPPIGIPIDVVLFTPDEIRRWSDTTNHVVSEANKEGKVLHERP